MSSKEQFFYTSLQSCITSLMISGLIWGVCESLFLLAGHDIGEYDALFFGGLTYSIIGTLLGLLLTPLHIALRYKIELGWGVLFAGFLSAALYFFNTFWGFTIPFFFFSWYTATVMVTKTPLRMITKWKGAVGLVIGMLLVLGVFSLTPAKNVGRASMNSISASPFERTNVIVFLIEGLKRDRLDKTFSFGSLLQPNMIFTQAKINHSVDQIIPILMTKNPSKNEQLFVERGFQTVAIVNDSSLSHFSGLQQKFHHYVYLPSQTPFPMTEGTKQLMIYRWVLNIWRKKQTVTKAFYRPASEVLFSFRQYIQQAKEQPFFAVIHLKDCQSSEIINADYHQQLHHLDSDMNHFLSWFQSQSLFQNTAVWVVGVRDQRESVRREEDNYTPLFLFHPNIRSELHDHPIDLDQLDNMIGQEQQFLLEETLLLPHHQNTSAKPIPHIKNISTPSGL